MTSATGVLWLLTTGECTTGPGVTLCGGMSLSPAGDWQLGAAAADINGSSSLTAEMNELKWNRSTTWWNIEYKKTNVPNRVFLLITERIASQIVFFRQIVISWGFLTTISPALMVSVRLQIFPGLPQNSGSNLTIGSFVDTCQFQIKLTSYLSHLNIIYILICHWFETYAQDKTRRKPGKNMDTDHYPVCQLCAFYFSTQYKISWWLVYYPLRHCESLPQHQPICHQCLQPHYHD